MRGLLSSNLLSRNALSGNPIYMAITNTYESYELLADITISGSAVTSVDFAGLSLGKSDEILLVGELYSPLSTYLSLYVNNNVTATNYYRQSLYAYSTSYGGTRANDALICNVAAGKYTSIFNKIKLTNSGYIVFQNEGMANIGNGASACAIGDYYVSSTFTATSITQLTIIASTANAIGIGSRFQLYRIAGGA